MDILYSPADSVDSRNLKDAYAVGHDEAEMLSFGFDFSDWDTPSNSSNRHSYTDNTDDASILTSSSATGSLSHSAKPRKAQQKKEPKVKKASVRKTGSKLEKEELISTSSSHDSLEDAEPTKKWAPNLSRKFRDLKLYAFPSFDKCDSLLFFPHSMSRHLNSGDYRSLVRLLNAHLHKDCMVNMSPNGNLTLPPGVFVKMFELMNEAHPDSVLCVHTTKVVENVLNAQMYFKFTDSHVINRSLVGTVQENDLIPLFIQKRSERFKESIDMTNRSEQEIQQLASIVDSEVDLVVYGKVNFKLTFDGSKRVTGIDFMPEFTSMNTTQINCGIEDVPL